MQTGVITKWFPAPRAFGFIRRDDGQRDIFFHLHGVPQSADEIAVERRVSFEIVADTGDRDKAVDVRFINAEE